MMRYVNAAAFSLLFLSTGAYAHHPSWPLAAAIGATAGWVWGAR